MIQNIHKYIFCSLSFQIKIETKYLDVFYDYDYIIGSPYFPVLSDNPNYHRSITLNEI